MKRVLVAFLTSAAVMGGCMAVEPDPIVESPSAPPAHSPGQAQAWSYQPQSAKAATAKNTNDKADNTIVKAAYNEIKPAERETPPVNLGMLRLTNSKHIIFNLEFNDTTSKAATTVDVWGTTDMRNWKKYQAVSRSPLSLAVEVEGEGLYGFTMIAAGKGEPAQSQPPANDPPQVWVAVDLTKPDVQLIDAKSNVRAQTPALLVRWSAKDRSFGPQPITVLYAERPEGPWRPIAANLENSGRYEAPVPPHLNDNVYLRVQAADLMGNVGMSQTTVAHVPSQPSIDTPPVSPAAASNLSVDGK